MATHSAAWRSSPRRLMFVLCGVALCIRVLLCRLAWELLSIIATFWSSENFRKTKDLVCDRFSWVLVLYPKSKAPYWENKSKGNTMNEKNPQGYFPCGVVFRIILWVNEI
jgi:hypothetical protein